MSYQVLARKWRPKRFNEVIGQAHITKTLSNTIKADKVAHAYLFTGTRGVGKTTVARIFAKSLRCLNLDENSSPCLECVNCKSIDDSSSLDYIEIDGASNTGVDNIRELIENVQYLPTSGDRKVYVIDEVHMLSVSAFNALLKTLEEPPAHVVFIFATTDPEKLLGTVLSRCQRFDFKHVDIETLKSHIDYISEKEGITFSSDKIKYELAKYGDGSVRDTLSLLDQVLSLSSGETIDEDTMLLSLGLAKTQSIKLIINSLFSGDKDKLIKTFESVIRENIDIQKFAKQILDTIFELIENVDSLGELETELVDSEVLEGISISELLWIYEVLLKDTKRAFESISPQKMILFSLIKVVLRSEVLGIKGTKLSSKKKTEKPIEAIETVEVKLEKEVPQVVEEEATIEKVEVVEENVAKQYKVKNWENVLEYLFIDHKTLASNYEHGNIMGDIQHSDEEIKLEVGFSQDDKIFYDYLNTDEAKKKTKAALEVFFETTKKVRVQLKLIDTEAESGKNFLSKVQINNQIKEKEREEKLQRFKDNKFILEAQNIFNTELTNIVLKEE